MLDPKGFLEKVYKRLANSTYGNRVDVRSIPHSDVFFVRRALSDRDGTNYSLDYIQITMWLEGLVHPDDVKKIPKWYWQQYMGGKEPDMLLLTDRVRKLYNSKMASRLVPGSDDPTN